MKQGKWPKKTPELNIQETDIASDWMQYWFEINKDKYSSIIDFGHRYVVSRSFPGFLRTMDIGAGLGDHLKYEKLSDKQLENYVVVEQRENMLAKLKEMWPEIKVFAGDCQMHMPFSENYFDRIIAVHLLEHLPNLPAFLKQARKLLNKEKGQFLVVIPCEGGLGYSLGRRFTSQRLFEKRYRCSYNKFIESEHVNTAAEILTELKKQFKIIDRYYYPLRFPSVHINLCLGLTLRPLEGNPL